MSTICVAGKNRIAVEGLSYILENFPAYTVVACTNANDDGIDGWQPSFKHFCEKNQVSIVTQKDLYEIEDLIFISLEYDKIIRTEKYKTSRFYNIHFSKLPAYKGMYTSIMPLINGEIESAATLHKIDAGIDTGDIIDQLAFPLGADITGRDLYELYLNNAIVLFKKNVNALLKGTYTSRMQAAYGSSYYSKKTIDFNDVVIDMNKTAVEIHDQVRAFTFREYQLPVINNKSVYKSEILNTKSDAKPGLVFENEWHAVYNTIDFQIKLYFDKIDQLVEAAKNGDVQQYQLLKENGYPVNVRTKEGWNAMIIACHNDHLPFVQHLIADGWDINLCNYKGTSAFMYAMTAASKNNKFNVFNYMCGEAVDFAHRDWRDRDVLSYAIEYGNPEVIAILKNIN